MQAGSLVAGHVAGLAVAHDRAVTLFRERRLALRSQFAMLALMVLYTSAAVAPLRVANCARGHPGAIVEAAIALAVVGVLVWAWLRERRRGNEPGIEEHGSESDGRR